LQNLVLGTFPNVGRNAIVNVSEIVCYDIIKESILQYNLMTDNIPCHFVSAVIAGLLFKAPSAALNDMAIFNTHHTF
jgi:solute carrier family 25 (mitochondrial uncoupling protein), member 8/9